MNLFPTYPSPPLLRYLLLFISVLSVNENITVNHLGDEPVSFHLVPCLLCFASELKNHCQRGKPGAAPPGLVGPQSHRREG